MSGEWKRGTVEMVGHPQTKGRATGENKPRPKPPRHTSTLPVCYGMAFMGLLNPISGCPGAAEAVRLRMQEADDRLTRGSSSGPVSHPRPDRMPPTRDRRMGVEHARRPP